MEKKAAVAAEIASGSLWDTRSRTSENEREREKKREGKEDSSRRGKSGKNRGEPSITSRPVFLQRQADISESPEFRANN